MGSIKKAFDLTGKTALVTGGSRGLGLQIAEAFGEQGARIVLSSRKAGDLKAGAGHLAGLGIKSDWIVADNAKDDDVKRLADEAIDKLGKVDILVNNAGATWGASTEDHPIEAWDKVMNLNIRSLFLLSQRIGKLSIKLPASAAATRRASTAAPAAITRCRGSRSRISVNKSVGGAWPGGFHAEAAACIGSRRAKRTASNPFSQRMAAVAVKTAKNTMALAPMLVKKTGR